MPVYTIPNNRALIDQLRNGFDPLIGNRPVEGASLTPVIEPVVEEQGPNNVGVPEAVETNIGIPEVGFTPKDPSRADPAAIANQAAQANAAEQAAQRAAADAAAQAAQNAAAGVAAAAAAGVLFSNETANATQTIGALATGTGGIPLATGNQFNITTLIENATANAYHHPGAYGQGAAQAANLYKRAPMPPLHPHIPSYMAHQDEAQANAMGASVMQFVKRASPAAIHNHIGIFLSAVLGLLVVVGAIWYINASVRKNCVPAAANQEGFVVEEEYSEKFEAPNGNGRRSFGLRQANAGHIGSFNNTGPAEEGGLRAAMGGNWNSAQRSSWETQRTGPPAYAGIGGLTDEKNPRGAEVDQGNLRLV